MRLRARKTSPDQYDFLLPVLFLKKVFFGLFSLVLLDWVTGSGPVEEKTGTIFPKCSVLVDLEPRSISPTGEGSKRGGCSREGLVRPVAKQIL